MSFCDPEGKESLGLGRGADMFISSPAPSWQKSLCSHLLALSDIKIRGQGGAQLRGVNQRSPSVLVAGWRGTERALETARQRRRAPPVRWQV